MESIIKLYFMLGLPTETVEDMEGIALLSGRSRKVLRDPEGPEKRKGAGRCNYLLLCSKPFTPFQWAQMSTKEEFLGKRVVNHKMHEMLNHKA